MTARLAARRPLADGLRPWVDARVLTAADVAVAATVCQLAGDTDPLVALGVALAVRAPRSGHVALDVSRVGEQVLTDVEHLDPEAVVAVLELPWPADPAAWLDRIAASPVTDGDESPLVVDRGLVYLRRFHRQECRVAERLAALAATTERATDGVDPVAAVLGLDPGQRSAVERCLGGRLGVLTGGPGTGKTRTVAALLAVLLLDGSAGGDLRIALAAPTGKAAARMGESIAGSIDVLRAAGAGFDVVADRMSAVEPSTVHRLLGVQRSTGGFRHHARRPLPHDVVIVDEASMLSLSLVDALLDALRPGARLVLVGDPAQLASVEAGSVLGDIAAADGPVADRVSELVVSRRFPAASRIGRFAAAVRAGDVDGALGVLGEPSAASDDGAAQLLHVSEPDAVVERITDGAEALGRAAHDGDVPTALACLERLRVLCAHRRGRAGVAHWNRLVESNLPGSARSLVGMYLGRPLLVTVNDPTRGLFNGDLGVVVRTPDGPRVAFGPGEPARLIAPAHLDAVETVHAMTIHKSQGSEFDEVVVILPSADSRLASRELLYTAVTRARESVTLVGDRATIAVAIGRKVSRTSGLRARLLEVGTSVG
jgi:exodeoxyribonuclease V alpha subunit